MQKEKMHLTIYVCIYLFIYLFIYLKTSPKSLKKDDEDDPKHRQANSRLVSEKEDKAARTARQSSDLNPIEHLWKELKRVHRRGHITFKI